MWPDLLFSNPSFPSVFEANEQALKRKTIEKLQALKTLVDMGNKNGFNPSQEDNGQRRITGNYKNRFQVLENLEDMENNKNINPSQEEDDPNKKQRITGNNGNNLQALENLADMENKKSITPSQVEEDGSKKKKKKNKIQPETKTETCCSWLLLPLDIMTNILSRLTPKSIAKFLCACKQWLSLTHDARFLRSLHASSASYIIIGKYIVNGKIELYDFSMGDGGKPKKISYRLNLGSKDYRLSNFVDGLTCLHYGNGGPKPDIYLLNPMTRELQKLPKNNSHCEAYEYESFGLGVDMNMGLYKIVRLLSLRRHPAQHPAHCEIYTVGTREWRCLGEAPFGVWCYYKPVLLHEALYWIGNLQGEEKLCLFRFSIKDEKFGSAISLPHPSLSSHMSYSSLRESGGKLWLTFRNPTENYFEIWTMKDYLNNTWVKEHQFHNDDLSSLHQVYGADVIDIVDGDILFRDYKSGRWNGISYNLCSGASHKLFLGGQQSDFAFYRESLISPKAVDGISKM
ncbi:putative F-box protein At5g15660 [Asparagus officinalis]|uniref:putative F-box protein At5g15660 n=1 Tax=Asparagus officinalis TaxID=4686 RepID=UPI00098E507E|nr:putative F-box protein At5g15660 [Asparagus officinalis]